MQKYAVIGREGEDQILFKIFLFIFHIFFTFFGLIK